MQMYVAQAKETHTHILETFKQTIIYSFQISVDLLFFLLCFYPHWGFLFPLINPEIFIAPFTFPLGFTALLTSLNPRVPPNVFIQQH
jgi:hypothetical protein